MEYCIKKLTVEKSIILANSYVNIINLKSKYPNELEYKIMVNCPEILKNNLNIPYFYKKLVIDFIDKL